MSQRLANIISYLLHPLFIPMYGLYILFNTGLYISFALNEQAKNIIYLIVFFNTVLIPGILLFLFYRRGFITNFMADDRRQRYILYITILIFYYSTYKLFDSFSVPIILSSFVLGATISILVLLITNFLIKASAHMVGIGGVVGMLYLVSNYLLDQYSIFLIPSVITAGIIGTTRLKLNAHRPLDIYLGFLIGFLGVYLTVYYSLVT